MVFRIFKSSESKNTNTQPAAPMPAFDSEFEQATLRIGKDFLERSAKHGKGMLSARFWSDKLMDWAMKDHQFKVQLFRFIDAFPMLKTPDQVYDHLVDYMNQPGVTPPPGMKTGLKAGGIMKGTVVRRGP